MLAVARRRSRRSTLGEDDPLVDLMAMATITASPDKERGVVDVDPMVANESTRLASEAFERI